MRTKEQIVVVTGASSGIGRAVALAFAGKGCTLALAARGREALDEVAEECVARGAQVLAMPTDVTSSEQVEALARRTVELYGRIDVWVNDAAVTVFGPFLKVPLEDFRRVLDVDIMGYVHGARAALPVMCAQGRGTLINVSSIVGVVPQPYTHAYGMAKAAVLALDGSLRQELRLQRQRGVYVCTVLPAAIDTPLFQHAANYTGRAVRAMPPVYTPERVARTIVSLARKPRRQTVVGPMGRNLVLQAKLMPGTTEKVMAKHADKTHLSRNQPAPASSGNLHQPASGSGSTNGGWGGRRKTMLRRVGTAAALAGAVAAGRRLFR